MIVRIASLAEKESDHTTDASGSTRNSLEDESTLPVGRTSMALWVRRVCRPCSGSRSVTHFPIIAVPESIVRTIPIKWQSLKSFFWKITIDSGSKIKRTQVLTVLPPLAAHFLRRRICGQTTFTHPSVYIAGGTERKRCGPYRRFEYPAVRYGVLSPIDIRKRWRRASTVGVAARERPRLRGLLQD